MDGAKLWCALRPFTVSMWAEEGVIADRAGASERVAILWIDKAQISLRAGHARDLAGWLLGWLAEHAPEERAKLLAGLAPPVSWSGALSEAIAAERDQLKAELDEARELLRIRTADRDSLDSAHSALAERVARAEGDLAAIADAVGLGGTRTRWEGQLLGKVENLIADVSDLRAANSALTDANRELRAVLAEVPAQREAAAVATFEAVRAAFAGCEVVIRVPEVARG